MHERPGSVRRGSARSGSASPRVHPLIKAFVLFHLVAIVAWSLPRPKRDIVEGRVLPFGSDYILLGGEKLRRIPPLSAYLQASGSWQYWDMFAPDPSNIDLYADAEVEFKDGTKAIVGYPRMYDLNLKDKYLKERYRKFFERAGALEYAYLWPEFAIQMARRAAKDPANPPVAVTLVRHTLRIVPPGEPQPTEYTNERYYHYILEPGDLVGPRR